MDKELIDRAWRILPAEFKRVVKAHYAGLNAAYKAYLSKDSLTNAECDRCNAIREKISIYSMYFGIHNLTSDAEGEEELLTVQRSKVIDIFTQNTILLSQGHSEYLSGYYNGKCHVLKDLFGSKCLPDEEEKMTEERYQYLNSLSLEDYDNETSADEQRQFCEYQHKHHPDEVLFFQTHSDEKPQPAEPKFKVGDTVSYILPMIKYKCTVIKVMQNEHSGKWEYNVMFKWGKSEMWIPESDLAPYTEPKFKVGDKVTVIDYNKGLPNLSRCEHKIFTVATVKWENGGYMYTLKTNEKLFKKSDYLDHLDWCEDYLEPYVEPEINTFKDLRKSGKYNRYLLCNDRYQEIALECMNPYERKMFATGIIAQLKEYYGGMVPFPQPIGCAKIVLCPDAEKFEVDIYRDWDALMTFHNIEQAERFLKYNEQLVRDYYMLPRKEESC